jgi:hypothetical protein
MWELGLAYDTGSDGFNEHLLREILATEAIPVSEDRRYE